jgi:hypothetical protein
MDCQNWYCNIIEYRVERVFPGDLGVDWEMWSLPLPSVTRKEGTTYILGEVPNAEFQV